jgi:hypothetical protein
VWPNECQSAGSLSAWCPALCVAAVLVRCCLSAQPMSWTPFPGLCWIAWRSSACQATHQVRPVLRGGVSKHARGRPLPCACCIRDVICTPQRQPQCLCPPPALYFHARSDLTTHLAHHIQHHASVNDCSSKACLTHTSPPAPVRFDCAWLRIITPML